jgi:PilZ domain
MPDQRHKPRKIFRRPPRRAAKMTFGDKRPSMNCLVVDISEIGARLAVTHSMADMPHHFTLSLFKDRRVERDCEVVWSDRRFVAVKFKGLAP